MSLPGSDIDVMKIFDNISVSRSGDVSAADNNIVMDSYDIKLGFVRLYCHGNLINDRMISSAMLKTNNGLTLSSLLLRDIVVERTRSKFPNSVAHGPCSMFVLPGKTESDISFCFACKTWPK